MNTSKYLIFGVAVSFALIVSGCNNVKSSEVIAQNVDKKNSSAKGKNAAAFILFWPALFLIDDNSTEAQQYARKKGEYEAVQRTHRKKDC